MVMTYSVCTNRVCRWAVLKHTVADETHWDLMLEAEEGMPLLTWRVPSSPTIWLNGRSELEVIRIGDHRPIYLTYEGEISGNRGYVTREASGTWKPVELSETKVAGLLTGGFTIVLMHLHKNKWNLTVSRP